MDKKFKKAFTLAETLIVLTVLGIVAAITIPTLGDAARKHSYETAFEKFRRNFSNAIANYMELHEYPTLKNSPFVQDNQEAGQKAANKFLKDNFKISKECSSSNANQCYASNYKTTDGETVSSSSLGDGMVLDDGSVVSLISKSDWPILAYVDTNGKKGPNVLGQDLWAVNISDTGIVSATDFTSEEENLNDFAKCSKEGKAVCTVNGVSYDRLQVTGGSTTYRLCLNPNNSNSCSTPTIQDVEGDYYITKLGMVNDMFTASQAKSDENCKTSSVGYDLCKRKGDYYNLAKTACKNAGANLPTIEELVTLKKYKSNLFSWGMFTWSSSQISNSQGSYGANSWYQMYSDGTTTNPKVHLKNYTEIDDRGVGNIQVLCVGK